VPLYHTRLIVLNEFECYCSICNELVTLDLFDVHVGVNSKEIKRAVNRRSHNVKPGTGMFTLLRSLHQCSYCYMFILRDCMYALSGCRIKSLFICGTLTPTHGLENLGLQDSHSGREKNGLRLRLWAQNQTPTLRLWDLLCDVMIVYLRMTLEISLIFLIEGAQSCTVICPIAIAYSVGQIIKSVCVCLSVCVSVRLQELSRSHFLIDFYQNWHRRKKISKKEE